MISLGINCSLHDTSVALVRDGEVVAAIEEERLTGKKHEAGLLIQGTFPVRSLQWILTSQGLKPENIHRICYAGAIDRQPLYLQASLRNLVSFARKLDPGLAKSCFYDHHLCHAASALAGTGLAEAVVLSVDGEGDSTSLAVHRHTDQEGLSPRLRLPPTASLGHLYTELTRALGFVHFGDEGKTMALADYGEPEPQWQDLSRYSEAYLDINWDLAEILTQRAKSSRTFEERAVLAATVQRSLEEGLRWLTSFGVKQAPGGHVCLAGGVAYNCKANYAASLVPGVRSLSIPFMPGDAGLSIGAAILGEHLAAKTPISSFRLQPYLGPGFTDEEIAPTLRERRLKHDKLAQPAATAAQLLAEGQALAWFQGRMEFGPRALGNRSILAPAHLAGTADFLNQAVKHREPWRPFAPSLLEGSLAENFATTGRYPYMAMALPVRPERRQDLSQVTSRDGSARVQTVSQEDNPLFWTLLDNYRQITGQAVLLNTSLNDRQKPLALSPLDALAFFYTSGLKYLIMGSFLVEK